MKTFRKNFIKKKPLRKASAKAQSAMEYLMTYGWAILIISVVLAALFQLGVFNSMTFAPKAPPGSCQVFRPNGPYTTSFINLEGICSGELPQYVAQFNGQSSSEVTIPTSTSLELTSITVTGWSYVANIGSGSCSPQFILGNLGSSNGGNGRTGILLGDGWGSDVGFIIGNSTSFLLLDPISNPIYGGKWVFLAGTYNVYSGNAFLYEDGVQLAGGHINQLVQNSNPYQIGGGCENGFIANVQIYNTSLSANEIQALYLEGIGGAPINLQHLVGWWPLNGNANDYSGNGNNGVPSNVIFVSNWYNGYTPP